MPKSEPADPGAEERQAMSSGKVQPGKGKPGKGQAFLADLVKRFPHTVQYKFA